MTMSLFHTFAPRSARGRRAALLTCAGSCLLWAGCVKEVQLDDAGTDEDTDREVDGSESEPDDPAETDSGALPPADGPVTCRTPDVDLLFVIDNSGSMAEEQQKLARRLPDLLGVLATGNHSGKRSVAGEPTDFDPAQTIHVGVISTDLGVNLAPAIESCGGASYEPTAPDPANTTQSVRMMNPNFIRHDKPFGDNAALLTSTAVAEAGIWARPAGTTYTTPVELRVEPDPSCAEVRPERPYLEYGPGDLFEDTQHVFSSRASPSSARMAADWSSSSRRCSRRSPRRARRSRAAAADKPACRAATRAFCATTRSSP
jgi:hypothetical protein